jgi:hypothetical protein
MASVADGSGSKVTIRWNGREVSDPSELPPEMRKLLEDADGNGIPDIAEPGKLGGLPAGDRLEVETVTSTVIDVDGKTYRSLDELPPELLGAAREALSRALPTQQLERAAPPRPVGPSWATVLIAGLAGAVVMYLVFRLRH